MIFVTVLLITLLATSTSQCDYLPKAQYEVLKDIYFATDGIQWTIGSLQPWRFPEEIETSPEPCTEPFAGVVCSCDVKTNYYSIDELVLQGFSLSGTIPKSLGNLSGLFYFDVYNNSRLHGSIPSEIGNLSRLIDVVVSRTNVSGTIPTTIGNLELLRNLDITCNSLISGTIPFEIGRLSNLEILYLFNNSLTGTIPTSIGNLINLQAFDLYLNKIYGEIPSEIGKMTALTSIILYSTYISGFIPSSIGKLTNLQELILYNNRLSSTIPSEIGNLSSVVDFQLNSNLLSGSLPSSIGGLVNVEKFYVHENNITGHIPSSIGNLKRLENLSIYMNYITGTIPPELFSSSLTQFIASSNRIEGSIPNTISRSSNLVAISLYSNMLNGTIPSSISSIKNLLYLYLNYNMLTGPLPMGIENLKLLIIVSVYSNRLTGTLPSSPWLSRTLIDLILYSNYFSGTIPTSLGSIKTLKILELSSNYLEGSIPTAITNISSLGLLSIFSNQITGRIPDNVGVLSSLYGFYLGNNFLSGTIPSSLFTVTSQLTSIYVNTNYLSGPLPTNLGNASNLNYLYLYSNMLSGIIPSTIASMTRLVELFLNNNKLTGKFFELFSDMPFTGNQYIMEFVDISDNIISGSISWDFSKFRNLSTIVATSNCLTGTFPLSICILNGTIKSIILDVAGGSAACSRNIAMNSMKPFFIKGTFSNLGLNGALPSCVFDLQSLETLSLSGNQLTGTIPELMNGENSALSNLLISNNKLYGIIPTSIQEHSFNQLDLSNNRLGGTLVDSFKVSQNQSILGLSVNRLSGPLPLSLHNQIVLSRNVSTLTLLAANIFGCNNNDIPSSDPYSRSYSCGLYDLTVSLIVMCSTVGGFFMLIGFLSVSKGSVYFTILKSKLRTWYLLSLTPADKVLNETKALLVALKVLKYFAIFSMVLNIFVLLPIYVTLNSLDVGTIVSYKYSSIVSMVFIHNRDLAIFLSFLLFSGLVGLKASITAMNKLFSKYFATKQSIFHPTDSIIFKARVLVLIAVLHLINILVTVTINALYVNSILNSDTINRSEFLVQQIGISVFKLIWNGVYIPFAILRFEKFVSNSQTMQHRYVMAIVNFIVAPCIATVTSNQSCFYNVIVAPAPITSVTNLSNCLIFDISINRVTCLRSITNVITITTFPPFQYSYACGTALLIAYIPVLIYCYVFNGFIMPVIRLIFCFTDISMKFSSISSLVGINPDNIKGRRILLDMMIHSTVLLTFGLTSPVLGVEIGLALLINIVVTNILIGRTVELNNQHISSILESNAVNNSISVLESITSHSAHPVMLVLENLNTKDSWRSLIVCFNYVIFVVSTFWSYLFFDMVADGATWEIGLIFSLLFGPITFIVVAYGGSVNMPLQKKMFLSFTSNFALFLGFNDFAFQSQDITSQESTNQEDL